ncbi:MAG: HAD family phosphatase [Cyclobacteriaceae bacterium]
MSEKINTIVFDLGGVLIDWNPRYLYRKIFKTEEEVSWFLGNICTSEWNDQQDAGRSFEEATKELIQKYPEFEEAISAWYGRWQETIEGSIQGTVDILTAIKNSKKYRLYALTNWSAETFPWALDNFHFLHWFEGIVVSGTEKSRKPLPEFFHILFDRYTIKPSEALFIDDNHHNIKGARALGMDTITFENPEQLLRELRQRNLPPF